MLRAARVRFSRLGTARLHTAAPAALRANFLHLYADVAWYGVLAGSAIAFVPIYAARLGAASWQIALFTSGPAVVNLLMTLPAGRWLQGRRLVPTVFWSSIAHRLAYLFWGLLPWLMGPRAEVWALICLMLLMAIPGVVLAIAFNAMYADVVPPEWRGRVTGNRNALLAVALTLTALLCGGLFDWLPFPSGYQITFGLGFLGALLSSYHLRRLRQPHAPTHPTPTGRSLFDQARPGVMRAGDAPRLNIGLRYLTRARGQALFQTGVLRGPFLAFLIGISIFNLAAYLPVPLYPIQWVSVVRLTDGQISLGSAVFYLVMMAASTRLAVLSRRWGDPRVAVGGALGLAAYPAMAVLSTGLNGYLLTMAVGGLSWALANGAVTNWLLERVPADARPAGLAWHNLSLNAAIFLGVTAGPWLAGAIGLGAALWAAAGARLLAALCLARCSR